MIDLVAGSGVAAWVLVLLALAGAALGAATGRALALADYRIESDKAGPPPRHWWWPAVALGLLWAVVGWRIGDLAGWAALPAYLLFAWLTVALVWIDADVHRLPDGLVLPAYPALLVLVVVATAGLGDWGALVRALACMAAMYALYFVLAFLSPNSLGFGDVKLSGLIGLLLGWLGVGPAVVALLAGFVVGGLIAIVMLVGQRVGMRSHIAFGPSMLAGAFLALVLEYQLVA
jgi:leader peptidase (prepilin peptidase)/N-methyltransferase